MKRNRGFTLIELLIVVAIIGIIAAIAYPSYQDSVRKTRRHDAMGVIQNVAAALERYKVRNGFSYAGARVGSTAHTSLIYTDKIPVDGNDRFYTLSLATTTTTYTITATAQGPQAKDGNLSLDERGNKIWTGNPDGSNEWDDK